MSYLRLDAEALASLVLGEVCGLDGLDDGQAEGRLRRPKVREYIHLRTSVVVVVVVVTIFRVLGKS